MRKSVGHLSKGVAIYGAGDAAMQVVKLLLLAVYGLRCSEVVALTLEDYG